MPISNAYNNARPHPGTDDRLYPGTEPRHGGDGVPAEAVRIIVSEVAAKHRRAGPDSMAELRPNQAHLASDVERVTLGEAAPSQSAPHVLWNHAMKTGSLAGLLALAATAAAAGPLPLKPGTYVLTGSPCADHANAAEFSYDGKAISDPHASHCRSKVLLKTGQAYRIATTCSGAGDGSPARPVTITSTYAVRSSTTVRLLKAEDHADLAYRWCPAA
jgi:hypothetical protein